MTPFTDIGVAKNCQNPDSYGEICVKCNKCGRYKEPSEENLKMWREIFEEERRRKENE